MNTDLVTVLWFGHSHKQLENRLRLRYKRCDRVNDGCELLLWFNTCEEDDPYISSRQFIYIKYWLHTRSTLEVNSNGLLTEYSVEEGKIAQVWRVLGQSEKTSGQPVPHQSAAGIVLQHTVLDDLGKPVQKELEKLWDESLNDFISLVFIRGYQTHFNINKTQISRAFNIYKHEASWTAARFIQTRINARYHRSTLQDLTRVSSYTPTAIQHISELHCFLQGEVCETRAWDRPDVALFSFRNSSRHDWPHTFMQNQKLSFFILKKIKLIFRTI